MKEKTMIIAEAGVNHNGDINLAKELIDVAAGAGVDFVKFQTFKTDKLVTPSAKKAQYQVQNFENNCDSQFEMLKKLELSNEDHLKLISYCKYKNIGFFSTAFDIESINYLCSLNFNMLKVPSGEITNYPYLRAIGKTGLPTILSTGMSNLEEIKQSIEVLTSHGTQKKEITVLHCNTEYPTPMRDVNLKAMLEIKNELGVNVGYSDHTLGIEVPIAAVAMGAKVIEKHFTLNRNLEGPDHKASLEPDELKRMVEGIRNVEEAISGSGIKKPSYSELKNISIVRKSICLRNDVAKGDKISEDDLISLRPGDGISPMRWTTIIGKRVKKDLKKNSKLNLKDLI